jgi:hypothetical protein
MRPYGIVFRVAMLVCSVALGAVVLTSLRDTPALEIGGVSLWPFVVGAGIASVFVASWAYAKSKGRSGWLGLLAPFFDVFGFKMLSRLERKSKHDSRSH